MFNYFGANTTLGSKSGQIPADPSENLSRNRRHFSPSGTPGASSCSNILSLKVPGHIPHFLMNSEAKIFHVRVLDSVEDIS